MGKGIVFCADGTWNGPRSDDNGDGLPDPTNVLKLFSNLPGSVLPGSVRKSDEQEKAVVDMRTGTRFVAKYIHGLGDSSNPLTKLLGGAFGVGFVQRIVRGYTFLSRHYASPQDAITLVGFSRGAYTVRALAGMVGDLGLLNVERLMRGGQYDEELAYKSGLAAWSVYRRRRGKQSAFLDYVQEFAAGDVRLRSGHPEDFVPDVRIKAIGVWDTVGSYGIPQSVLPGQARELFEFADRVLDDKVEFGFHAISIDERRADFAPTVWAPRQGVRQAWFAGAHADVGGGYAECQLSDYSLQWMQRRLEEVGVPFLAPAIYPGDHADPTFAGHRPWEEALWRVAGEGPRRIEAGARFHASVQERLERYPAWQCEAMSAYLRGARQLPPQSIDQ